MGKGWSWESAYGSIKNISGDLPGNPVAKTPPASAGGAGSIPGRAAKFPHALWPKNQNIKQKPCYNKFNTDFKRIHIIKKQKTSTDDITKESV